jgi:hypothetical protein
MCNSNTVIIIVLLLAIFYVYKNKLEHVTGTLQTEAERRIQVQPIYDALYDKKNYVVYTGVNTDIDNSALGNPILEDLYSCQSLCLNTPKCTGFSRSATVDDKVKSNCWLKKVRGPKKIDPNYNTYELNNFTRENYVIMSDKGVDIGNPVVDTYSGCVKRCKQDTNCKGFSRRKNASNAGPSECWLKSDLNSTLRTTGSKYDTFVK